jgi:hypothetical protein
MSIAVERVTLPNGYWVDGIHFREAELRMLTGADEEFMAISSQGMLPVAWTNALLSRCVTRLSGIDAVTPQAAASLTVGDREALVLHLRRLTFGERMQCILTCPQPDCGKLMDLELKVSDLLQPPNPHPVPLYELSVEKDGERYRIRFHLPTGADQEAAGRQASIDIRAASDVLLQRCVEDIVSEEDHRRNGSFELLTELPARMTELDPQAELVLHMTCPECGEAFSSIFDASTYLMQETGADLDNLYREVHLLAIYYHWSEAEIMGMNTSKRRRYLNLLLDSVSPRE